VDFHQEYGDQGLVVVGLSSGGTADTDDLLAFIESTGTSFPVVVDSDATYNRYVSESAITPYPIDIVTDSDGVIVYFSREYDPDALRDAVERVLP
jgi:peroxiredoxin